MHARHSVKKIIFNKENIVCEVFIKIDFSAVIYDKVVNFE